MAFIEAKDYRFFYPDEVEPAVFVEQMEIKQGTITLLVGPSGCGKSTLLSLIAGLLTPESGSVLLHSTGEGEAYCTKERKKTQTGIRKDTGYMLQKDHLFEWRTIYQNVILGLEIQHRLNEKTEARVEKMLRDYGLWRFRNAHPSELSGGMRQRAALIRTLAPNPELLLLDEPFSALDYQTRLTVSADIAAMIRKAEKSVILITHDLAEAISLADRVLILSARPARVKAEFPIHLTAADHSPLAARRAPEYGQLFNQIWEELSNENN